MPQFELITLQEAQMRTASGQQGQNLKEYGEYINQLERGKAGKLTVASNEKAATIKRRLTTTDGFLKKELEIKQLGDEIFFWLKPKTRTRRESQLGSEENSS